LVVARIITATVNICLGLPEDMGRGRWRWALPRGDNPIGVEAVFRGEDLESVMAVYGALIARSTDVRGLERFRLTAHGRFTGRVLGEAQYVWHPKARTFVPVAPPVILWPEPEDLPPELRALAQSPAAVSDAPWWERGADIGTLRVVR
jgi:hypothetical protein